MQECSFSKEYSKYLCPTDYGKIPNTESNVDYSAKSNAAMNAVLSFVLKDDGSFASSFWCLVNNAPIYHTNLDKLREDDFDEFHEYIMNDVQSGWEDNRKGYWNSITLGLGS
ncbi:hypothetical protein IW140_002310 [Coemansia sp. RSA 1813]|nr:hypothetical protein EV178_001975 [Coemansia sp. RSA 1646]KAJ1769386.1 hypothetical protein LPJ74_004095 [Coemansia sp. RSA 1843]KAJ2090748.1 hypothetical protein IW138_002366 [Coemansia sp. RSA 986]KAJ2215998.1 hypothetical protein EV179_001649 [Coemansia sp. RSA 487]KAJ2570410.1 hypothetical protein IW140_002310 [Coemansia sp. RSA 1813]